MAVDKFSISLPRELVSNVDEIASADGLTRSAVIREATASYVAERRSGEYERRRRERMAAAQEGFDAIAGAWGSDETPGIAYLRELRGEAPGPSDDESVSAGE
ncbi:MAG: ribbon-helix-helix protein, CopG family [Actinomycetota bacterium]|nr:ribbon-helix-helix protein, CopG family [Actinomycetota bacterium]